MFKKYDAYSEATKNAQVNINTDENRSRIGYIVVNLFFITLFTFSGYFLWSYLNQDGAKPTYKKNVMGVSHTIDENRELMMALEGIEVKSVMIENSKQETINNALSEIIDSSLVEDHSKYTNSISKEIKDQTFEQKISDGLKSIH
jgi:hypothetical protein